MNVDNLVLETEQQLRTRSTDQRAPRATALEQRLARKGGYCDCEIFLNAYRLDPRHVVSKAEDDFDLTWETASRSPVLSCRGVRRGSTQGCEPWRPLSRGW